MQQVVGSRRGRIGQEDEETVARVPHLPRDLAHSTARLIIPERGQKGRGRKPVGAHRQHGDRRPSLHLLGPGQHPPGAAAGDEIGPEGLLDFRQHRGEVRPVRRRDEHHRPVG